MGENIGTTECNIPMGSFRWRPIRQPVVLDEWPAIPGRDPNLFTTISTWRGHQVGWRELKAPSGLKADALLQFVQLPSKVEQSFEIALNLDAPNPLLPGGPYPPATTSAREDVALLKSHGWRLVDPRVAAPDPHAYRSYIQGSGSEFSALRAILVETRSGAFSDRSACYLASGKPVLVQDTGFGRTLPVGEGLVSFQTLDDAVAGARCIARDYRAHCEAARTIAEEYFDSDTVLSGMLDEAGVAP
jgi:hypothetical protein